MLVIRSPNVRKAIETEIDNLVRDISSKRTVLQTALDAGSKDSNQAVCTLLYTHMWRDTFVGRGAHQETGGRGKQIPECF